MTDRFHAILVAKDGGTQELREVELGDADLMPGNVRIAVSHSTLNYKDGLALTGHAPVV